MDKAIYGKVALLRGKCPECKEKALIVESEYQCCGMEAQRPEEARPQKMTQGHEKRRSNFISPKKRIKILEAQGHKCCYCDCDLKNSWYMTKRSKSPQKIRTHYDHIIPWAYSRDDDTPNIVATCHICNSYKSSRMFESLDKLKDFLQVKREKNGVIIL